MTTPRPFDFFAVARRETNRCAIDESTRDRARRRRRRRRARSPKRSSSLPIMVYRRASGVCRPDPSSSAADGWMDGWMDAEPNQTIKSYCLHIHTNTSQCVPHARASHCGINRTVYAYKHKHIHPSQYVRPSVSRARVCVPLWDKPYCLHIQAHIHTSVPVCPSVSHCVPLCPTVGQTSLFTHTYIRQTVRPSRTTTTSTSAETSARRSSDEGVVDDRDRTTNRFGSSDDDDRTPTNDRDRRRVVVERTNDRTIGTGKAHTEGGPARAVGLD